MPGRDSCKDDEASKGDVSETRVTENGIANLQRAMPSSAITR